MEYSYRLSRKAHLLLAIEGLEFAKEQQAYDAYSAETARKIALALASAERDLAKLEQAEKRRKKK
jgi:hypothetical protein